MREPYVPLFCSITNSTLWQCENSDTRVVFITLLAMADPEGYVASSLPGIAKEAHLPLDVTRVAMERLGQPDPDSRSKEFEGRRVLVVERGWRVVNIKAFRDLARREAELARKRKWWNQHRGKGATRRSLDELDAPGEQPERKSESLDATLDAPKAKAKGKQRERELSLPKPDKPADPFGASLRGHLPQRADVAELVGLFNELAEMRVKLSSGDLRATLIAETIDAYGADACKLILAAAKRDDTVNGKGEAAGGREHWDLRYIFKPGVRERLLKDGEDYARRKRPRVVRASTESGERVAASEAAELAKGAVQALR